MNHKSFAIAGASAPIIEAPADSQRIRIHKILFTADATGRAFIRFENDAGDDEAANYLLYGDFIAGANGILDFGPDGVLSDDVEMALKGGTTGALTMRGVVYYSVG